MSALPEVREGNAPTEEIVEVPSEIASSREQFVLSWGRESLKASSPALTDALHKLAVLNGVLIGAAVLWAEKGLVPTVIRAVFVSALISSLAFSIFGACPKGREVNGNDADDVWEFEIGAIRRKTNALWWAGFFLMSGFIIALVGLIVRGAGPSVQ